TRSDGVHFHPASREQGFTDVEGIADAKRLEAREDVRVDLGRIQVPALGKDLLFPRAKVESDLTVRAGGEIDLSAGVSEGFQAFDRVGRELVEGVFFERLSEVDFDRARFPFGR